MKIFYGLLITVIGLFWVFLTIIMVNNCVNGIYYNGLYITTICIVTLIGVMYYSYRIGCWIGWIIKNKIKK